MFWVSHSVHLDDENLWAGVGARYNINYLSEFIFAILLVLKAKPSIVNFIRSSRPGVGENVY